jgi:hypothetical protein
MIDKGKSFDLIELFIALFIICLYHTDTNTDVRSIRNWFDMIEYDIYCDGYIIYYVVRTISHNYSIFQKMFSKLKDDFRIVYTDNE